MPDWSTVRLEEVADLFVGFPFRSSGYVAEGGVRLLRGDNVIQKDVRWDGAARWPLAEMDEYAPYRLELGDIAIAMDRPWIESGLKVAEIRADDLPSLLVQRVTRVRARELVHPKFLCAVLYSNPFTQWVKSIDTGTTVPHITKSDIGDFRFALPPLPEQRRIAGVLGAFDDLIETNRDLARSQEALARALGSRGDGEVAIEELAEVPKLRQRRPTGLVDHFAIPAFDNGQLPAHDLGSTILSGKYVLRQPSVLLSRLNPSTPRTWMAYPGVEEAVCSPEFVVLTGRHGVSTEEVWAVTSSDDFWKQMQSSVGGTTNSRQRVDKAAVPELIVPDVRLLSAEERAAISTLVRGAHELRVEAADLAAHRDELLPLLMSGKVRVSEVEGVA